MLREWFIRKGSAGDKVVSEGSPKISADKHVFFDVFKNQRRRYIIQLVAENEEIDIADLAEQLTIEETGNEPEGDKEEYKKRYVSLYQTHLPMLNGSGLIDYSEEAGVVEIREDGRLASDLLEIIDRGF
ncbi:hypothetical protein [Halorubrum sp. CSM-61]|uniref:DUF7344 domain-containing protein n=1 Tax=Halorubrum sp. CSM-61 TaxID=2485838 RepID=UPI000F4C9B35|nr:hypothetical protein [Halorubrum sp. CSM-61]